MTKNPTGDLWRPTAGARDPWNVARRKAAIEAMEMPEIYGLLEGLQPISAAKIIRVCLKMLAKPLNPMVLLIIIPIKWLFHWEYTLFSDKPIQNHPTSSIQAVIAGRRMLKEQQLEVGNGGKVVFPLGKCRIPWNAYKKMGKGYTGTSSELMFTVVGVYSPPESYCKQCENKMNYQTIFNSSWILGWWFQTYFLFFHMG